MNLINATVSHELRNPLNSIYASALDFEEKFKQLKEILQSEIDEY